MSVCLLYREMSISSEIFEPAHDQKSDIYPNWMAAHARLKNEFTEDEKYHTLMSWLIYGADPVPTEKFSQAPDYSNGKIQSNFTFLFVF